MKKKILLLVIIGLILIPPVVALAADITIDSVTQYGYDTSFRTGIYWTSPTTGYALYREWDGNYVVFQKTTNGGANWGSETDIAYVPSGFSSWADWNTPGNDERKIHFAYVGAGVQGVTYQYFNTFNDTSSSAVTVESTCHITNQPDLRFNGVSITETTDDVLGVSYKIWDGASCDTFGFEISSDGGNTWLTKNDVYESGGRDHLRLFPANSDDDIWGVFWDTSASELSLKTFDVSGNSWGEDLISDNMTADLDDYLQFNGDIRHTDGHLIVAAWSELDSATAELRVWDINGGSDITQLTNVVDGASERFQTSVLVDQSNNDLYVFYLKGTIGSSVGVYYQKSTDGGTTWSGEITFSSSVDNFIWVDSSGINPLTGGRVMPTWWNYDGASSDLLTYYPNSLEIEALPRLVLYIDGIERDSATFFGDVSDNSSDWVFCANNSVIYMESANITIDDTEISQWDWEYDTTFYDSIGSNHATPTFRLSGMSGNVTANITSQESTEDQGQSTDGEDTGWDMITGNLTSPENLFTSGGTDFPGGPEICTLAAALRIPCIVFLVLLAILTSLLGAVLMYAATFRTRVGSRGSLLAASMVALVIMIFWVVGGGGVIPGWILAPYGLVAILMLFWRNPFSNPIS